MAFNLVFRSFPNRSIDCIILVIIVFVLVIDECVLFVVLLDNRIDNSRVKSLEFEAKTTFTMHGFAGYFETILYKDITLS